MKIKDLKKLTDAQLSQIKTLEILDETVKKKDIEDLIALLPKMPALEMFTCKGKQLKGKLFTRLADQLSRCPSLSYLFLPNNQIDTKDLNYLGTILPKFKCLVAVELVGNKLKEPHQDQLQELIKNIKKTGTLVTFDVSGNSLNKTSLASISNALNDNRMRGEQLIAAVKQGNLSKTRSLLANGAQVNTRLVISQGIISRLESPLHIAAEYGDVRMVRFLLHRGAQLLPDGLGKSPLDRAQKRLDNLSTKGDNPTLCMNLTNIVKLLSPENLKEEQKNGESKFLRKQGMFAERPAIALNKDNDKLPVEATVPTY
ncbi:ankyrin repeat domain-containing protein [Legionella cardiaca]|uniref:Ankyrin repeat domain-containing protein n=1 Tax=Legionella cardiaca TaxID=1071983 RepID=A0ABY8ARI2_9GAMM|nr:ankyrin repeat domain-containing protein [Legionella cardiaca]WED42836.1 ankyrin repeat domain-containing protein [Legionella cardiaca]